MEIKTAIRSAREVIGQGSRDDYIIVPTKHAAQLEKKAPGLAQILRSSEVETIAQQYEDSDRRANVDQSTFKHTVSRVNVMIFISAIIGTALVVSAIVGQGLNSIIMNIWLIGLGVAGVVFGALGRMWMDQMSRGHMLELWMKQRASAETLRLRYFELVTKPLETANGVSSTALSLLQLEYFTRYQFEVQLAYYSRRGDAHRRTAKRTLKLAGWAVFLGSIGAGLGGVLGGAIEQSLASIAALGMIGAALSSYATNTEAVNQDRRNAERYSRTRDTLLKLRARLDDIRDAVAVSHHKALELFVTSVHEQLSLEHRQWISTTSGISSAISKLEEALAPQDVKPNSKN